MENNNNGRGIFYGVIGVATLVVAIIGATFAYFSAATGRNDAVNLASTTLTLRMEDIDSNFLTDMIPVETETNIDTKTNVTMFAPYPGLTEPVKTGATKADWTIGKTTCSDDEGNSICGVYQFSIKNPSTTTAQQVVGSLEISANTGFTNLTYAVFKGAASEITSYNVNAGAVSTVGASAGAVIVPRTLVTDTTKFIDGVHTWTNTTETLAPEAKTTYTLVIWLEEAGEANKTEMGKAFAAGVHFSNGSTGVTGSLSASS